MWIKELPREHLEGNSTEFGRQIGTIAQIVQHSFLMTMEIYRGPSVREQYCLNLEAYGLQWQRTTPDAAVVSYANEKKAHTGPLKMGDRGLKNLNIIQYTVAEHFISNG